MRFPPYLTRWLAALPLLVIIYFTWWLAGWAYAVAKPYWPDWGSEPSVYVVRDGERVD